MQRAVEAWSAACRLRKIIDVWRAWLQGLQSTGDADGGAALRLAETATHCVEILMALRADVKSFKGRTRDAILGSFPREPSALLELEDQADYIREQAEKLRRLYPLQGDLQGVMNRLVMAPSAAFLLGEASESPEAPEKAEGACAGPESGGTGQGEGAGTGPDSACVSQAERLIEADQAATRQAEAGSGDEPDLKDREKEILRALLMLKADSKRRSVSRLKAARKADPEGKPSSYNKAIASLAKKGLIVPKRGTGGGIWLTSLGVSAAEALVPRPS